MPSLYYALLVGATATALTGAATGCGISDIPTRLGAEGSDKAPASLAGVKFRGDDPGSWPFVEVCGNSLLMSPNPSGQGASAIYRLASGDATPVKVRLPADSELEPTDDWTADLDCARTDDGVMVVALFGSFQDVDGAWAGFDLDGNQRWVREYTLPSSYERGYDVMAVTNGETDVEKATAELVDLTNGEVTADLAGGSALDPILINGDRYVGADGLVDLSGNVINSEVRQDSARAFGDGRRVLAGTKAPAAYDANSGERLWTSSVPAYSGGVAYDASTNTLVWEAGETLYGVDAETGEKVWTHPRDTDLLGSDQAGSGIVIVGSPRIDDGYFVLDSKTGRPVRLPPGLHVLKANADGIVIVEDGKPSVVERDELA